MFLFSRSGNYALRVSASCNYFSFLKNGALLSLAEGKFDALITIDQGFEYQQNLKERRIAVLLLVSRSN